MEVLNLNELTDEVWHDKKWITSDLYQEVIKCCLPYEEFEKIIMKNTNMYTPKYDAIQINGKKYSLGSVGGSGNRRLGIYASFYCGIKEKEE